MKFGIGIVRKFSSVVILAFCPFIGVVQAAGSYGFESNVPTFFLNGYHASLWYGENGRRARVVAAKAVYPDAQTETGFKDKTLTFLEIEFDFFFGANANRFRGFWLAGGFGRTRQEITSKSSGATASINTTDFHFGGGYTFEVAPRITVNPWLGGDYHLNAPDAVAVGNETWHPKQVEWVGGVKLGIDL